MATPRETHGLRPRRSEAHIDTQCRDPLPGVALCGLAASAAFPRSRSIKENALAPREQGNQCPRCCRRDKCCGRCKHSAAPGVKESGRKSSVPCGNPVGKHQLQRGKREKGRGRRHAEYLSQRLPPMAPSASDISCSQQHAHAHTTPPFLSPAGHGVEITTRETACPLFAGFYQQPIDNEYSSTWSVETTTFAQGRSPGQAASHGANRRELPHGAGTRDMMHAIS